VIRLVFTEFSEVLVGGNTKELRSNKVLNFGCAIVVDSNMKVNLSDIV